MEMVETIKNGDIIEITDRTISAYKEANIRKLRIGIEADGPQVTSPCMFRVEHPVHGKVICMLDEDGYLKKLFFKECISEVLDKQIEALEFFIGTEKLFDEKVSLEQVSDFEELETLPHLCGFKPLNYAAFRLVSGLPVDITVISYADAMDYYHYLERYQKLPFSNSFED